MMANSQMVQAVAVRNSIRASAGLPLLDSRELSRLNEVEHHRLVAAVFEAERHRFDSWINSSEGFWGRAGRWSMARRLVAAELKMGCHVEQVLIELGYRAETAQWQSDGTRTFTFTGAADEVFRADLEGSLVKYGWIKDVDAPSALVNVHSGDTIEFR